MTHKYKSILILGPDSEEFYKKVKDLYVPEKDFLIIGDGERSVSNLEFHDLLDGKIDSDTRIDIYVHGKITHDQDGKTIYQPFFARGNDKVESEMSEIGLKDIIGGIKDIYDGALEIHLYSCYAASGITDDLLEEMNEGTTIVAYGTDEYTSLESSYIEAFKEGIQQIKSEERSSIVHRLAMNASNISLPFKIGVCIGAELQIMQKDTLHDIPFENSVYKAGVKKIIDELNTFQKIIKESSMNEELKKRIIGESPIEYIHLTEDELIFNKLQAIALAVSEDNEEIVDKLKNESNKDKVKTLLEEEKNLAIKKLKDKSKKRPYITFAEAASFARNEELLKLFIDLGVDVNLQSLNGSSPLHCASQDWPSINCIKLLLSAGANCNALNRYKVSPLMQLIMPGELEEGKQKEVAYHKALQECIKLFHKNGAIFNIQDNEGKTAAHYATTFEQREILEYLILNGADLTIKCHKGERVIDVACAFNVGFDKIIAMKEMELSTEIKPYNLAMRISEGEDEAIKYVFDYNNQEELKKIIILEDLWSSAKPEYIGISLIAAAAKINNTRLLERLVTLGAKCNMTFSKSHITALAVAADYASLDSIDFLLKNGADVNAQDRQGFTAFMIPYCYDSDSLNRLIKAKPNLNIQNQYGQTAAHLAATNEIVENFQILIKNGTDCSLKDMNDQTALDIAKKEESKCAGILNDLELDKKRVNDSLEGELDRKKAKTFTQIINDERSVRDRYTGMTL